MTPQKRIDGVKQILRGMGLHGLVEQIDQAWNDLIENQKHVVGAYLGENLRMRSELKSLGVR